MTPDRRRRLAPFIAVTLACLVYLAGVINYAGVRRIDGDEGYYTSAARLVWEGKVPYRDFSYPQGPLIPYLYSWIWGVHPRSLIAMRHLSAACGGLAVFFLGVGLLLVKRLPIPAALATFAVVLLNPYWISWNVVLKTFAVTNVLMTIAVICLYAALHSERFRWYFISGFTLGACASARLLYGPLIPAVSLWFFFKEVKTSGFRCRRTFTFLAGATAGLLPVILSFAHDPRAFIFNNVSYHSLLASHESLRHTVHVYALFAGIFASRLYLMVEILIASVGIRSLLRLRKQQAGPYTSTDYLFFEVMFLMLVVYSVTALIPFPTWIQYFDSPLFPFLLPFVAEGIRVSLGTRPRGLIVLAVLAPVLFYFEIGREAAEHSPGAHLQQSTYQRITRAIEVNGSPNDVVLSFWPGFVFESGTRFLPGSEDQFVYSVTNKISADARSRYHIISKDEMIAAVTTREVDVVVTPLDFKFHPQLLSAQELEAFRNAVDANYSLVDKTGTVAVYRRRLS